MSVFAPALGALWRQLEGYGIDPAPLFREEGIEPELIFDAGARVPVDRYQRLDERGWDLYHAQKDEADALKKIRRRPRSRSSTSAV